MCLKHAKVAQHLCMAWVIASYFNLKMGQEFSPGQTANPLRKATLACSAWKEL